MLSLHRQVHRGCARRLAIGPLSVAAASLAAILAAGCGGGSSGGPNGTGGGNSGGSGGQPMSAAQALAAAASQARTATSYSATMHIQSNGGLGGEITATVEVRTKPSLLAHEKLQIPGTGTGGPGSMEMILNTRAIYMKLGALSKLTGKPWVKLTFHQLKSKSGINFGALVKSMQTSNPLADTMMMTASRNVREVGTATVNGVATTEYAGSFKGAAGLTKLTPQLRKQMRDLVSHLTTRFKIWVDSQHQVRKMALDQTGAGLSLHSEMLVNSINQPVHVQIPPASQVAAFPSF